MRTFSVILLVCLCALASAKLTLRKKSIEDFGDNKIDVGQRKGNILRQIKDVNEQFLCKISSLGPEFERVKSISKEDLKNGKLSDEEKKLAKGYAKNITAVAASLDKFIKLDEEIIEDVNTNDSSINAISQYADQIGCTGEKFAWVEKEFGACGALEVAGPCLYHAVHGIIQIANDCNGSREGKLNKIKHIVQLVKKEEEKIKQFARDCHPIFDFDQAEDTETRVLRKLEEYLLSRKST